MVRLAQKSSSQHKKKKKRLVWSSSSIQEFPPIMALTLYWAVSAALPERTPKAWSSLAVIFRLGGTLLNAVQNVLLCVCVCCVYSDEIFLQHLSELQTGRSGWFQKGFLSAVNSFNDIFDVDAPIKRSTWERKSSQSPMHDLTTL